MTSRDVSDAMAALDRLVRNEVVSLEEARQAARVLTGDPNFELPAPAPSPNGSAPHEAAEGSSQAAP